MKAVILNGPNNFDVTELPKDFTQMCDEMEKLGDEIGVSIRCQREDIFEKMHRV